MFTEGDVREIVTRAVETTVDAFTCGDPRRRDVVPALVADVMREMTQQPVSQPHAHECEGRLCTVCAEWRARHNLIRYGGNAD